MSTSETPPQGPPLRFFWAALAVAFAVTAGVTQSSDSPDRIWRVIQGILGGVFWILLFWSAKRGGWLKWLVISLAVLALVFGICVAVIVGMSTE